MIAYHGSMHRFEKFRISSKLVERRSTMNNEGCGIYFSTNRNVAESYGRYLYTLEINDDHLLDFRKKKTCQVYINGIKTEIKKQTGIDISSFYDLSNVVSYAHCGGISISGIGRDLALCLDSTEEWYTKLPVKTRENILRILRKYDQHHLEAYMFTYHIKNIGVIKKIDDSIVTIKTREKMY